MERGTLFQSFEEVAFQLEPGELSDAVETPVGLHLIQMIEKRGEKVNVRHILIRTVVTEIDESRIFDEIKALRKRIIEGEDFGELAKSHSDDETTSESGGDLGWLEAEQIQIDAFKNAIQGLEVGEVSEPFSTQFGYHIIKLEDKKEARKVSLEEDWDRIYMMALNMKQQRVIKEWIEELKKSINIQINDDLLNL